ncbi:MAG: discoidin domain-containing protein, partial [Ignavibacteriaceae bacterium]|nr:discoidin domain-containing protein [Ignavibacteriaceae bacterium]
PTYGSVWAKNEEQVWAQIQPGVFVNPTVDANLLWILASGPFNLSPKQTVPYYACMMFAPDDTTLLTEAKNAKTIYDYNYNPSGLIRFFDAASNTEEVGQQNILSIFVSDGSDVELNGQNINGVNQVNINADSTTSYTLTTKGVVSESKKITVQFVPPGKIKTFSVDNAIVELGVSDSSFINWSASGGSKVTLNGVSVPAVGTEKILPQTTTQYILVAKGLTTDTSVITVQALTTDKVNRALNQKMFSSLSVDGNSPKLAVDGNTSSYWQSQPNSAQWITVDLGKTMNINRVVLNWGALYGTVYQLQAIDESKDTTMLLTNNNGKGGTDDFGGFNVKGRYVRMLILSDNYSSLGCRLNEFQVYGKLITTDVNDNNGSSIIPKSFSLEQNYPNPFNPSTTISWQLPTGSFVTLRLYDILGKEIASLVNEYQNAGVHSIIFNTQQLKGGRQLSSGIYLYRLQASGYSMKSGNFIATKKMILLK